MAEQALCQISDLDPTGAKEVVLDQDGARLAVFIVKCGAEIRGYVNSCPHARLPLNWRDDAFFDISRTFLFCANHGAHFDVMTGLCLRGPCKGQSLAPFPVAIDGQTVVAT